MRNGFLRDRYETDGVLERRELVYGIRPWQDNQTRCVHAYSRNRVTETGGKLQIQVLDNGRGLPEELLGPYARRDRELSRGHLGLYNVDTILIKYYGEGFGLYLENRTDGPGAVVTATLPIRREEKAQC